MDPNALRDNIGQRLLVRGIVGSSGNNVRIVLVSPRFSVSDDDDRVASPEGSLLAVFCHFTLGSVPDLVQLSALTEEHTDSAIPAISSHLENMSREMCPEWNCSDPVWVGRRSGSAPNYEYKRSDEHSHLWMQVYGRVLGAIAQRYFKSRDRGTYKLYRAFYAFVERIGEENFNQHGVPKE